MRAAAKKMVLVQGGAPSKPRRVRGHLAGTLVGRDGRGPLVDFPGNLDGPVPARSTVPQRDPAAPFPQPVLLVFEEELCSRPVIVGYLEPEQRSAAEAVVDGRRIVLEAQDEIELRCGQASITLRRNGRVVIRGAYVETRSRGINRVKGGSVQIN